MSERHRDEAREAAGLVGDLAGTIEELQGELAGSGSRGGLLTPRGLARFTSEVTIPAIILALETNVRALELLQRALRLAAGERPSAGETGSEARERAEELGRETLARLDDALADLQEALAGRPPDDPARELLAEARTLRGEIDDRLATGGGQGAGGADAGTDVPAERGVDAGTDVPAERGVDAGTDVPAERGVDIDVESELQSIKDDVRDGEGDDGDGDDDGTRE